MNEAKQAHRDRFSRSWAGAVAILLFAGACGSAEETDAERMRRRCGELRDHLVELQLQNTVTDRAAHRAALAASMGAEYVDACAQVQTTTTLDCGIAAASPADAARCFAAQGESR